MTTTTTSPQRETGRHEPTSLSTVGVLRSEWVKLRSVRSLVTTLAASSAVLLVVGLVFAGLLGGVFSANAGDEANEFAANPAGATLQGVLLAQLIIGVLGVMVITSEYSSGMIRSTLAVVPGRQSVLWAKAAVVACVTFPVMLVSALAAFFAGQLLIGSGDIATASITDPGVLGAIVGTAGCLTGVTLMGLAVGTLLRSTAAAISTLFAVVFLLPGLGQLLLPESIRDSVLKFFPPSTGESFTSVFAVPGQLGTGAGIAVFVAWVAVPLVAAAIMLKRRNA